MTEEEAKTKWCPFARVYSQIYITGEGSCSGGWNRHPDDKGDIPRCIGSACMAWRSIPASSHTVAKAKELLAEDLKINAVKELRAAIGCTLKEACDIADGKQPWPPEIPTSLGFCGLAGKL